MPLDLNPSPDRKRTSRPVDKAVDKLIQWSERPNIADDFSMDERNKLGARVVREYKIDEASRAPWLEKAKKALEQAKLKRESKNYPFEGASNVKFPLLTVAALQFASRAYPSIVDGQRIVKCQVIGADPDSAKRTKAERIGKHMSWQLSDEMPEWEEDTDWLLHQLPVVGCCFRKVWRDSVLERNRSEMVSALDLVVNNSAKSMETVPRITQRFSLYPHEIEERVEDGLFSEHPWQMHNSRSDDDDDAPHEYIEQYRLIDLDNDGMREPWIVTVHVASESVARITANFDPEDVRFSPDTGKIARIPRNQMFVKYPFFRDPEGGFYDLGFGELLESMTEVIDSTINQMMDAGHLQNAGGGFIGSGLRLKKNQIRFAPGQYHVVQSSGQDIRQAIYNMEHPGPSPVLFQLLGMLVESGKEIASIKDILSGDMPRNQPATTTLAMIEQGMKVYTAIYKRIYRALKAEYRILFELNAKYLPEEAYFTVLDERQAVARADYDVKTMDVAPVADPNIVTDAQKMTRAQVYLEVGTNPAAVQAGVDPRECLTRFFDAIGADEIEKLIPPPPPEPPPEAMAQTRAMEADVAQKEHTARKAGAEADLAEAQAVELFKGELGQMFAGLAGEQTMGEPNPVLVEQQQAEQAAAEQGPPA